jgi:diaminopimelate epimerase
MELHFFKLDGAGNDFVGLDWRSKPRLSDAAAGALALRLCNRPTGAGADGLLLIEAPTGPEFDFTMRYLNRDGSEGGMCGNGARCIARLAHELGAAGRQMRFLTGAGPYRAEVFAEAVRVDFPSVNAVPREVHPAGEGWDGSAVHFLQVGVPHVVAFVKDLEGVNVLERGVALRRHSAFAPAGTNANFAELVGGETLRLRTYERGVEAETLACGTGSVATACCFAHRAGLRGKVELTVIPTSGIALQIGFEATGLGFDNVTLTGPANVIFEGRMRG